MNKLIRISYKYVKWIISIIVLLISSYMIFAILLSLIPVNRDIDSNNEIDIYIKSNGVHLDIVLPLRNEIKDWTTDIWIDDRISQLTNFISFGWGHKQFYRNTQEWSDLSMKTAINAIFLKSPSAFHIVYYKDLQISDKCKLISINIDQYKTIIDFIENSFLRDSLGHTVKIQDLQYNSFDVFYDANDSYNLFYTCNTWTNKCLKESGLKACVWTPFDKGTLFHYRK